MKKTLRLIKRFILLVIVIMPMLFALNLALFVAFTYRERSSNSGWEAAKEIGRELAPDEGGSLQLSEAGERILAEFQAWGILVEDGTGDVIWHSEGLPDEIPCTIPRRRFPGTPEGTSGTTPPQWEPEGTTWSSWGIPRPPTGS